MDNIWRYMIERGYLALVDLRLAEMGQDLHGGSLEEILLENGWVIERDLYEAKAMELGLPFVDLTKQVPDQDALALVPKFIALRDRVLPVRIDAHNGVLWCAIDRVGEIEVGDSLRLLTRRPIRQALCGPNALTEALRRAYGVE